MSSLLVLPTEMLQNIIDRLKPDDLVNFSVCCKQFKGAAERRLLEHRELIKTYSKVRYNGCFRHGDVDHPVELLREICLDEHIAFYPRNLTIMYGELPEDFDELVDFEYLSEEELLLKDLDRNIEQVVFDEFETAINEKLSKALCYNDRNINVWRQRLKRDARSVTLCLLLLLLPNLEELHVTNLECEGVIMRSMLDLIAGGNHDPDPVFGPVALTKLSRVSVTGCEQYCGWSQVLVPLAAIPSLRTLTTKSVFGNPATWPRYKNLNWPYEQHVSGLTVLNLQSSYLIAADFSRLLGGIKGLKSFTYDLLYTDDDNYGRVPMRSIIGMLLEHAKHSLESVTFTDSSDGRCERDHGSGSFRGFEVLEQIRINSGDYLKDVQAFEYDKKENHPHELYDNGKSLSDNEKIFSLWYDDVERLVDLLPASVKSVQIDGNVDAADIDTLLKELPKRKAQCVPHLKTINFTGYPPWDHVNDYSLALAQAWCERCRKVGVDLFL